MAKMTPHEYQAETVKTAIYPAAGTNSCEELMYLGLGLAGEAGEVASKISKLYRDMPKPKFSVDPYTPSSGWDGVSSIPDAASFYPFDEGRGVCRDRSLIAELGDVMWYLARLAAVMGVPLEDVMQENLDKLRDRQKRGKLGGSGDKR